MVRLSATCLAALALALTAEGSEWSASQLDGFDLGMKTLVIGSGRDNDIPELVLEGYSTPYETTFGVPSLSSPDYQAIVVADNNLSGGELANIRNYCAKYGARVVYLNASPSICGASSGGSSGANVVFDSNASPAVTDILNTNGGWQATGAKPASASGVTPLMRFSAGSGKSSSGGVAAFINNVDGCEQMCFTFDATKHQMVKDRMGGLVQDFPSHTYTETNLALGHMWFTWATHGLFIGARRLLLNFQVDDWFIPSDRWSPTGNGKNVRVSGEDCQVAVSNMHELSGLFPPGSKFKLEPAINGFGIAQENWEKNKHLGVGLNQCSQSNQDEFFWVSHTYTHQHLDWANGVDCHGHEDTCKTPPTRLDCELEFNAMLMKGQAINPSRCFPGAPITPAGVFKLKPENWSPGSLVTPEISGLVPAGYSGKKTPKRLYGNPGNTAAFTAMRNNGINTVVGDNSRDELKAKNPHHGKFGENGVLIIPRHSPSMAYNCDDPACVVSQWKHARACEYTPGLPCRGFSYEFDDIIARDAKAIIPYLLQLRADPVMFHQANVISSVSSGGQWSLATYWAKTLAKELGNYINQFPVTTYKMDDLGKYYRERIDRDGCGINGKITISGGKASKVSVRGSGCTVLVSATKGSGAALSGVPTQNYGGDATAMVKGSGSFGV